MTTNEDTKKLRTWRAQLDLIMHDNEIPAGERSIAAYLLENKIKEFSRDKAQQKKDLSDARYDIEGETLTSRYWTKSAQEYHPRSTIYEFRKDNLQGDVPVYEIRPKKMAEMARDYHDKTQDMDQPDEYSKILATSIVLEDCNKYLTETQHAKLDEKLNVDDINTALKMSKNGSAPGLDGLPYEFYSWLHILYFKRGRTAFLISHMLKSRDFVEFSLPAVEMSPPVPTTQGAARCER
jgi:hypothetical protein